MLTQIQSILVLRARPFPERISFVNERQIDVLSPFSVSTLTQKDFLLPDTRPEINIFVLFILSNSKHVVYILHILVAIYLCVLKVMGSKWPKCRWHELTFNYNLVQGCNWTVLFWEKGEWRSGEPNAPYWFIDVITKHKYRPGLVNYLCMLSWLHPNLLPW